MPPIADRGMAVKTKTVSITLPNVMYSNTRISSRAAGTAMASLALAALRFSKAPP